MYKVVDAVKTYIFTVLFCIAGFVFLGVFIDFVRENAGRAGDGKPAEHSAGVVVLMIVLCLVCFGIAFLIFYLGRMKPSRCPYCNQFFALKEMDTKAVGSEDIYVSVENKIKNINGEVTGTQEQHVPGKRIKYQRNFICKKCGASSYKNYTRDTASV